MSFQSLGLSEPLLRAVQSAGYETPTEIQALAIPPVLAGSDVIGRAKTGSGKTAAVVLPILDRLEQSGSLNQLQGRARRGKVRALILAPTRELAQQINESARKYGRFLQLRSDAHYGGVSIEPQIDRMRHGMDILAATPGRLLDHLVRGSVDLSICEVLIVDEADRMFDMGFINDVKRIIALIPKERQTLLFSATINDDVRKLAAVIMRDPIKIELGIERSPVDSVRQQFLAVERDQKIGLLFQLLGQKEMESVLVFSRTKHGADKISKRLDFDGVPSAVLHANRSQSQRMKALEDFKRGRVRVLIATDIAARGIDVQGISHVINFDTPTYAEDYIHRIGRTGRAEATGDAITFVSREERIMLKRIESFTGMRFRLETSDGQMLPDRNFQARTASRQEAYRSEGYAHQTPPPRNGNGHADNRDGQFRRGEQRPTDTRNAHQDRPDYRDRRNGSSAPSSGHARNTPPFNQADRRDNRDFRPRNGAPEGAQARQDRSAPRDTRSEYGVRSERPNGDAGFAKKRETREARIDPALSHAPERRKKGSGIPEWALPVAKKQHARANSDHGKRGAESARPEGASKWSMDYSSTGRSNEARRNDSASRSGSPRPHSSGSGSSTSRPGARKYDGRRK